MLYANSRLPCAGMLTVLIAGIWLTAPVRASGSYEIFVSNERSGDITVIEGSDFKVVATVPVGKRPRGIHASPDGERVYVALSGTPIEGPPPLDAQGNPILKKNSKSDDDDDDNARADKSADGIGMVSVAERKLIGKLHAGSDPEEFALSKDGSRIYVSNEDIKAASVLNIASGRIEHIIPVGGEPEGVGVTPDGRQFYVTCETSGDIFVIDTGSYKVTGHFMVPVRPRSVDFLADEGVAFIPSESKGELNVIDTATPKLLRTLDLPAGSRPMKVRVALDGRRVYVSDGRAGTVSVLDSKTYSVLGTIKVGKRPWGLALSPDGKYLFSANGPSNDVSVVDLATNREVRRIPAGEGPWGLTIVPLAH
jgi:YVTN family beta-propeller protein